MLPPDRQLLREAVREHQKHLNLLARRPWAPTQELSWEEQEYVEEERLRLRLRKFWGLMHEADRPWQRPLIIHLCCSLPSPTRKLYRRLKPSTLQHLIAQRCKVEKSLHSLAERCRWHVHRLRGWWQDAVQGSPSMSATQHQVLINQMGQMERELTWVRAELGRQANYARAAFADQDHVQYCQEQLQPVIDELEEVNNACVHHYLPHVERGHAILRSGSQALKSPRKALLSTLGPIDMDLEQPCYSNAQWRYPPNDWVRVQRKGDKSLSE